MLLTLSAPAMSDTSAPVPNVGAYNVEYGHPVTPHVKMILQDARKYQLDVLGLEEIQDYLPALRKAAPPAGYRVIAPRDDSRNALLVKNGHPATQRGSFKSPGFYYSVRGHRVTTASNVWARIGGVTYVVVHAPVHAWTVCRTCRGGRGFFGPSRRLSSYRLFVESLIDFAKHHPGPIAFMGDWNATPGARGLWSPNYLRRSIGGHFARPFRSTGHGEIDFAVVRGVTSARVFVRPNLKVAHSDHLLVTTRVATHGLPTSGGCDG